MATEARGKPVHELEISAAERRDFALRASTSKPALLRAALFVAPFAIAFAVYLCAYLVMRPAAMGDKPHYFLIAESLLYDRDVKMTNDYASRERTLAVCQCFPLEHHAFHYTPSRPLYPWH